jgi:hypothetical protein
MTGAPDTPTVPQSEEDRIVNELIQQLQVRSAFHFMQLWAVGFAGTRRVYSGGVAGSGALTG